MSDAASSYLQLALKSSEFCIAATASSSITAWLGAKSKSHAPHCVCGGTSHLILLFHVGEHALSDLDICGHGCDTAATVAATWFSRWFDYVVSVAAVVVNAAVSHAAVVVNICRGIFNAHQSHKLGCHFAVGVLRK